MITRSTGASPGRRSWPAPSWTTTDPARFLRTFSRRSSTAAGFASIAWTAFGLRVRAMRIA